MLLNVGMLNVFFIFSVCLLNVMLLYLCTMWLENLGSGNINVVVVVVVVYYIILIKIVVVLR